MTELELIVISPVATINPGPLIVEFEIVRSLLTNSLLSLYVLRFIVLLVKEELFIFESTGPDVHEAPFLIDPSLFDCVCVSLVTVPEFSWKL